MICTVGNMWGGLNSSQLSAERIIRLHHSIHYWRKRRGESDPCNDRHIALPDNWDTLRNLVIKRDKACVNCSGEGYAVHHIDKDRLNNDMGNLVYLCVPCHLDKHH